MPPVAVLGKVGVVRFERILLLAWLALGCARGGDCVPSKRSAQEIARAWELEKKAQEEFQRGEYIQAATDFRQATCLAPASGRIFYGLGVAEAAAGNHHEALEALKKADQLQPDNFLPLAMLMKLNLSMGDMETVKEVLRLTARRFPRHGQVHAQLAKELVQQRQYDLALAESLRFERTGERDWDAMVTLAFLEATTGAYGDAIRHAVAIEAHPALPEQLKGTAAGLAGLSCESLGQRDEAVRHLKLAIQLTPSQENAYLALARIYEKEQQFADAAGVLQQARAHIPDSHEVLAALGSALVSNGDLEAGTQILTELIDKSPDQFDAYVRLADARRKMGEPESATQALKKLAQRKPDYPMVHVLVARSMLDETRVDDAGVLAELVEAERAFPTDFEVYYLRGKVYMSMGKYREAIMALRHAIELQPTEPSAHYQLGLAYQRLGQTVLAKEEFARMKHLKPPLPELR